MYENGLVVDVGGSQMYQRDHPEQAVPLQACDGCSKGRSPCSGQGCAKFDMPSAQLAVCSDGRTLTALCGTCQGTVPCTDLPRKPKARPAAKLTLPESFTVPAGETVTLAAVVDGVEKGRLTTLEVAVSPALSEAGLVSVSEMRLNPTLGKAPLVLKNTTDRAVELRKGQEVAHEAVDESEDYEEKAASAAHLSSTSAVIPPSVAAAVSGSLRKGRAAPDQRHCLEEVSAVFEAAEWVAHWSQKGFVVGLGK